MNLFFIISALLIVGTGLIHSILGERLLVAPLLKRDFPIILGSDLLGKRTLRFAWHLMTITLWSFAAILILLSAHPLSPTEANIVRIIAATFFTCSIISLVAARGRHFSWLAFLIIGLLALFGI